jgi:hypothetical protein
MLERGSFIKGGEIYVKDQFTDMNYWERLYSYLGEMFGKGISMGWENVGEETIDRHFFIRERTNHGIEKAS